MEVTFSKYLNRHVFVMSVFESLNFYCSSTFHVNCHRRRKCTKIPNPIFLDNYFERILDNYTERMSSSK